MEVVGNDALLAIERAQIDTQIATAKRYPRNIASVKTAMLTIATLDEETASSCFYTLPRGGKTVQGPSVRMAEIALSCYGNVKAGTRILSVHTGDNPHAVVQAVVHDLEKNVAYSVEKRRRIVGKKSKGGVPDEDDINLAVNAGSAIAFRDAVFKVVPGALTKSVTDAAMKVAVGDVKSLAKKRDQVLGRLKQMGATEARILSALGLAKVEEIDADKLGELIGIGTALKDGSITIEEAFPNIATADAKPIFKEPVQATVTVTPTAPAAETAIQVDASEPATKAEEAGTPQERLAALVIRAGFTLEDFNAFAIGIGFYPTPVSDWPEVPVETANRILRSPKGLITQLKGGAK
jgi:hypothetical protein